MTDVGVISSLRPAYLLCRSQNAFRVTVSVALTWTLDEREQARREGGGPVHVVLSSQKAACEAKLVFPEG
jgi:hypothetical protein